MSKYEIKLPEHIRNSSIAMERIEPHVKPWTYDPSRKNSIESLRDISAVCALAVSTWHCDKKWNAYHIAMEKEAMRRVVFEFVDESGNVALKLKCPMEVDFDKARRAMPSFKSMKQQIDSALSEYEKKNLTCDLAF